MATFDIVTGSLFVYSEIARRCAWLRWNCVFVKAAEVQVGCIRDATSAAISASEQLRDHCWLDGQACISAVYVSAAYTSAMGVHLTYGHVPYRRASHAWACIL
jgi:hypothetical protein